MPEAGRHLTFELCGQIYAMNISKVREILRDSGEVHFVPELPESLMGFVNLRGDIVPLTDLRKRLKLPPAQGKQCVIVTDSCGVADVSLLGFAVDKVCAVEDFASADLTPSPKLSAPSSPYITGIFKGSNRIVLILDPEMLITADMTSAIDRFVSENTNG